MDIGIIDLGVVNKVRCELSVELGGTIFLKYMFYYELSVELGGTIFLKYMFY